MRARCIQYLCSWVMHFIIAFAMKPLGQRRKETTLNGSNVCSGEKRRFSLKPFHHIKYPGLVTHLSSGLLVYAAPCHHFSLHSVHVSTAAIVEMNIDVQMCVKLGQFGKKKKRERETCVSTLKFVQL